MVSSIDSEHFPKVSATDASRQSPAGGCNGTSAPAYVTRGEYHAFTGMLKEQDGTVWLADGAVADDGTLTGMSFYV